MKAEVEHGVLTLICDGTTEDWEAINQVYLYLHEKLDVETYSEWPKEYLRITPYLVYTDEDLLEEYELAIEAWEIQNRWGSKSDGT